MNKTILKIIIAVLLILSLGVLIGTIIYNLGTDGNINEVDQSEIETGKTDLNSGFVLYPENDSTRTFTMGIGTENGVTELIEINLPTEYLVFGDTYELEDIPSVDDTSYMSGDLVKTIETGKVHNNIIMFSPSLSCQLTVALYEDDIDNYTNKYTFDIFGEYEFAYRYVSDGYAAHDNAYMILIQINEEYLLYASYASDGLEEDEIYDFAEMLIDTISIIE